MLAGDGNLYFCVADKMQKKFYAEKLKGITAIGPSIWMKREKLKGDYCNWPQYLDRNWSKQKSTPLGIYRQVSRDY